MKYNISLKVNKNHRYIFEMEADNKEDCLDKIRKYFKKDNIVINYIKTSDNISDMIDLDLKYRYSNYINEGD